MTIPAYAAALVALGGNALLSLGMVLQKRNISCLDKGRPRDAAFRRSALGWFAGFMLVNIVPAFNYVALLGLPPNVVGAMAGTSLAFTALLSVPILGERLGSRRLVLSAALFAAIIVAGLRGSSGAAADESFSPAALYAAFALPLAVAAAAWARRAVLGHTGRGGERRKLALLFAAVAGSCGGFMVLPERALQIVAGDAPLRWLATPFLYLFLGGGLGGFVHLQVAYKDGEMTSVAPVYYGMQVLWPALASYSVFAAPFDPIQAAAFAALAICVGAISKG
jgi:drug/metabolite transporter (DMT)-like permease